MRQTCNKNSAQCAKSRDDSRSESRARRVLEDNSLLHWTLFVCVLSVGRPAFGIVGGDEAEVCAWPSAVAFRLGNKSFCTGTLVHPELVITAAHCVDGNEPEAVLLGENGYAPQRSVEILECEGHPDWSFNIDIAPEDLTPVDIAYCRLAKPVTDVPIVPILMGCETDALEVGADVVLAGFGRDAEYNNGPKKVLATTIKAATDGMVTIGGGGEGGCHGDSGGPAFVRNSQGQWRVFGITSTNAAEGCGGIGNQSLMHKNVAWVEKQSGLDITPCHDADGTWAPSKQCRAFPESPQTGGASWADGCVGPTSGPSKACGAPLSSAADADASSSTAQNAGTDARVDTANTDAGDEGGCSMAPDEEASAVPTLLITLVLFGLLRRKRGCLSL